MVKRCKKNQHKCFHYYCTVCKKIVEKPHQWCFISKYNQNENMKKNKFTVGFFDIESIIGENGVHEPNLIVWSLENEEDYHYEMGKNCIDKFMEHIVKRQENNKDEYLCLLAHNLRSYDGIFIMQWFFRHKLDPSLVIRDQKILQLKYNPLKIIFRDSLNWIAMALNNFVKSFALDIETKKFFPLLLNTEENLEKNFEPGWYPELDYFLPNGNNLIQF